MRYSGVLSGEAAARAEGTADALVRAARFQISRWATMTMSSACGRQRADWDAATLRWMEWGLVGRQAVWRCSSRRRWCLSAAWSSRWAPGTRKELIGLKRAVA